MTQTAQQHSPAATAPRGPATTRRNGTATQNPMGQHRSLLLTRSPARDVAGALSKAGIDVVGQAATTEDAVGLSTLCRPDTLLVHVGNDDNPSALFAGVQVELPLVVLAESADPELIRAAVAAGALAYVVAPFTPERLIPALEMAGARNAELAGLRATVTDIKDRLDTRKIVERAKGLLMAHERLTEQDAFRFIQRTAMDRRSSMRDVANAITQKIAGAA